MWHGSKKKEEEEAKHKKQIESVVDEKLDRLSQNVMGSLREESTVLLDSLVHNLEQDVHLKLLNDLEGEVDRKMMLLKSQVKAMFEEEIRQAGVAYAHAMEIRTQEIEERRRILLACLQNMTSDNEKIVIEERKQIAEDSSKAKSALEDLKKQREQVMQKLDDVIKEAQEEFQSLKASLNEQQQQWKESTDLIIQSIARGLENAKEKKEGHQEGREKEVEHKPERVVLNVGGTRFETFRETLTQYPTTLLGAMFSERNSDLLVQADEFFFDRDSHLFHAILHFYRSGTIVRPTGVPHKVWHQELDYWNLPRKSDMEEDDGEGKQDTLGKTLRKVYEKRIKDLEPSPRVQGLYDWVKPKIEARLKVLMESESFVASKKWPVVRIWRSESAFINVKGLIADPAITELFDENMHTRLWASALQSKQLALKFEKEDNLLISFTHQFQATKRDGSRVSTATIDHGPAILIEVSLGNEENTIQEEEQSACTIM